MRLNKIKSYYAFESKSEWVESEGKLVRLFEFDGFKQALSFINSLAQECEARGHHPEIVWEYDKITLFLSTFASERVRGTTHDAGFQITEKDLELAQAIDSITVD